MKVHFTIFCIQDSSPRRTDNCTQNASKAGAAYKKRHFVTKSPMGYLNIDIHEALCLKEVL